MAKLFGFKIQKDDASNKNVVSPVPKNNEDSSDYYVSSGFYGQYVDIDGVYKSEYDLIKRYREMALHPEVDSAIEDIINEAIVSDQNDSPVEIDLENLPASSKLKDIIREEFKSVKEIMDFDKRCHEIFRNWYVDGRIFYHKVIDLKKPEEGLQEIRYIDPLKIKLVRKLKDDKTLKSVIDRTTAGSDPQNIVDPEIEEYYLYDPNSQQGKNNLGAIGQPAFSNKQRPIKLAPDSVTFCHSGLVDRNKNTILSYLNKSIKALNQLRMIEDSLVIYRLSRADGFNLGRSSEILRDEIKFTKFVGRMRKRFSTVFNDMLKTQLILKNIVTPEDWDTLVDHIQYDYVYDNHFAELKEVELINERLGVVAAVDPYVGKYYSLEYVRRNILKQKDEEIIEIDKQMEKEIKAGKVMDPMETQQLGMGIHPEQMPGGALNPEMPMEEPVQEQPMNMPKGGEI